MRGISEEVLKIKLSEIKRSTEFQDGRWQMLVELSLLCTELNPWLPIDENTPKDMQIKIYDSGYGQVIVSWNEFYRKFTDPHGHIYHHPTHYQELPEAPL